MNRAIRMAIASGLVALASCTQSKSNHQDYNALFDNKNVGIEENNPREELFIENETPKNLEYRFATTELDDFYIAAVDKPYEGRKVMYTSKKSGENLLAECRTLHGPFCRVTYRVDPSLFNSQSAVLKGIGGEMDKLETLYRLAFYSGKVSKDPKEEKQYEEFLRNKFK